MESRGVVDGMFATTIKHQTREHSDQQQTKRDHHVYAHQLRFTHPPTLNLG